MSDSTPAAPPLRPRARRRARNREQILATARRLVLAGGLPALTIQGLARELDYTPGALYRYFDSKETLLAELQRRAFETFRGLLVATGEEIDEELGRAAPSTRALVQLLAIGRLHRELPRVAPAEYSLLSGMLADPRPLVSDPLALDGPASALVELLEVVVARCEAAAEHGVLDPGDGTQRALTWVGAAQGVLQLSKLSRFEATIFDAARLSDTLITSLLCGWGASKAALRRAATHLDRIAGGGLLAARARARSTGAVP